MEIKFRAFIKHLNCIADVLSIDFMSKEVEVYLDDRDEIRIYPFDEVEILQFTGLTDKNGKEIYEGDILKDEKSSNIEGKVFFNEEKGWFEVDIGDCCPLYESMKEYSFVVIGNIYELLEGTK